MGQQPNPDPAVDGHTAEQELHVNPKARVVDTVEQIPWPHQVLYEILPPHRKEEKKNVAALTFRSLIRLFPGRAGLAVCNLAAPRVRAAVLHAALVFVPHGIIGWGRNELLEATYQTIQKTIQKTRDSNIQQKSNGVDAFEMALCWVGFLPHLGRYP